MSTHNSQPSPSSGDAIIAGAICAGLQAVGEELVSQGRFTQKAATEALTKRLALRKLLASAANQWIEQFEFAGPAPTLTVPRIKAQYRGEDIGVHFIWHDGPRSTSGVYPVNLKNEAKHVPKSPGKCRIGKRYGIIKRITGRDCNLRVNAAEQIAEIITGGKGAALGVGILAFAKDGKERRALAYDALHVYAIVGGPSVGTEVAQDGVFDVMRGVAQHCGAEKLDPIGTYENEGFLLQAQHYHAHQVWQQAAPHLARNGIFTSTLLSWFAARFDGNCIKLIDTRRDSLNRDYETSLSYL